MLIVALVLAVIGLASLVTAVVTSNEVVAWVCIGASAIGVVLLVVDAIRERKAGRLAVLAAESEDSEPPFIADAENTEIIESTELTDSTESDSTGVIETAAETEVLSDLDVLSDSDDLTADDLATEDHPEELVHDEPEYDMPSDDEPEYVASAEESAIHIIDDEPRGH